MEIFFGQFVLEYINAMGNGDQFYVCIDKDEGKEVLFPNSVGHLNIYEILLFFSWLPDFRASRIFGGF